MKLPNGYGSVLKLGGNRRKPFKVRVTTGFRFDVKKDKCVQDYLTIGYATTRTEGLKMLSDYHDNPSDTRTAKITFSEVYGKWSESKFPTISKSNINGYKASYKLCEALYEKIFKEIRLVDLQKIVDTCGENYPTLRKLAVLFKQLFEYAMKNDICNKDYAGYVDILKFKDGNPNKLERNEFSKAEIECIWKFSDDKYHQILLMLIYTGVRISEIFDLKKSEVHLEEEYFDILASKTENGLRQVPIADKGLLFP